MTLINDFDSLKIFAEEIINSGTDIIGLDLEGEFNLHRYGIHLCLIQIAFNDNVYIVDPVLIDDISPLKPIFESVNIEKVIYACNIDVRLLKYAGNINLKNIFDIRVAAINLKLEETGLSSLIGNFLNVEMEKDKKCQRSNWTLRPLSPEQLEYACNDVLYLIPLRNILLEKMTAERVLKNFKHSCRRMEKEVFKEKKDNYTRVANYNLLSKHERIFLKYYYNAREETAKKLNYPPFWVLGKDDLSRLAKKPPETRDDWKDKSGLSERAMSCVDLFINATKKAKEEIGNSGR